MAGLLDVILLYDCNLACDYCTIGPEMRRRSLSTAQAVEALRIAHDSGYDRVSFTGGEPTLRADLLGLVRGARRLGYSDVKVQSNGLAWAQPRNLERAIQAGVGTFHVSIHTHDEVRYDRLVRRPGTYTAMIAGLDNLVRTGQPVVVDVILKEDTYRDLPAAVAWLHARGVRCVDLWFVSLTDHNRDNVASLPRMSDAVPFMREAFGWAAAHGMRLRSLHVPRCLLGPDHAHAFDPGEGRVMVVTPDATFELHESRLAGQAHVPACEGCEHRTVCPGLRLDYLEVFGDGEIAAARGQPASLPPRRALAVLSDPRSC